MKKRLAKKAFSMSYYNLWVKPGQTRKHGFRVMAGAGVLSRERVTTMATLNGLKRFRRQ
jgi:hypothetical protein